MAVNSIFQSGIPGNFTNTQRMYERLVIESIKITGMNCYYLPRTWVNVDEIFTEDNLAKFDWAIPIEMHLDNVQGYGGGGSFLSKFGIEINDTCTFVVSKARWDQEVGRSGNAVLTIRPTEGDIIFVPMTQSLFEIKKVDAQSPFYQLGKLFVYKLDCEIFQYSSERLETGVDEIDHNPYLFSLAEEEYELLLNNGTSLTMQDGTQLILAGYALDAIDPGSQNKIFQNEAESVIDWNETNPFAEITT